MTDLAVDLTDKLAAYNDLLNERLRGLVAGRAPYERLYDLMAYHLGWRNLRLEPCHDADPGKRLRPAICFLVCEAIGGSGKPALPGAAAVELVHNFTLVHDDIEDGSWLRRHRRTVWSVWGVPDAINVGDGLFTLAQLAITDDGVPPGLAGPAARALNRACLALCEGQTLDLQPGTASPATLSLYRELARAKTGALFGCAAELGALFGGGPPPVVAAMRRAGAALGEAYQMADDLVGVWGEDATAGKPASDVSNRKLGLPAALACERATGADRSRLHDLYTQTRPLTGSEVAWVVGLFDVLDVRSEVRHMIQTRLRHIEALLHDSVPAVAARQDLLALVTGVLDQSQ